MCPIGTDQGLVDVPELVRCAPPHSARENPSAKGRQFTPFLCKNHAQTVTQGTNTVLIGNSPRTSRQSPLPRNASTFPHCQSGKYCSLGSESPPDVGRATIRSVYGPTLYPLLKLVPISARSADYEAITGNSARGISKYDMVVCSHIIGFRRECIVNSKYEYLAVGISYSDTT